VATPLQAGPQAHSGALRAALCEAAWSASRSTTGYLPAQYRHLLRTFGKQGQTRAVFAVGHSILVIAWQLLAHNCDYHDLGGDHFVRHADAEARWHLIRQLEALGHKVTVEPAAA
jgi:transposase